MCGGVAMLTRKQYELLVYIDGYLKDNGVSPSFDEMKDALGLQSKSGIHRRLRPCAILNPLRCRPIF